jgi:hypothetical protein
MFTTGWHDRRLMVPDVEGPALHEGGYAVHQASILFSFFVLLMGGIWIAMHEMSGAEAEAAESAVVEMAADMATDIALAQ